MFPVDCLPTTYVEDRMADDKAKELAKQKQKPAPITLAQPTAQRPAMARTISSTLFGLFPSARQQTVSANSTPAVTPHPSPRLTAPAKAPWFEPRPIPKATDMDVTCLPPAWS